MILVPGITVPSPGFNWETFRLARHDPALFLRVLKAVVAEAGERAGRFDPTSVDFSRFRHGFNFSDIDPGVVLRVKEYLLKKIHYARSSYDIVDVQRRNLSQWQRVSAEDIELDNITWDGVVHGRVRMATGAPEYAYSPNQKALLFGVVAVGALSTILLVSYSIERFGCRRTFGVVGLSSALSTALCPLAASLGFVPFLAVRFLQGVGFAACFPVIGSVTAAWAKRTENGLFNGFLTSFIQVGLAVGCWR